jgi:hypothetical protein
MDYLRNLGSAAVSSLVQKSGLNLPFSLGSKLAQIEKHYNLYDATKRVFLFSLSLHSNTLTIDRTMGALFPSLNTI